MSKIVVKQNSIVKASDSDPKYVVYKICTKCPDTSNKKLLSEFHIIKNGTAYRSECKACNNAMCRAYKATNRAKISAYNKTYKADNAADISVYNHKYNLENRDAITKRQTSTRRIRRENDANFKITTDLRAKLHKYIKRNGNGTSNKIYIEKLLGCDWNAFELWLTYQFDNNMTFANYGTYWTIDHVTPCSSFDCTISENAQMCFHWANLRPAVKIENNKKVAKIIPTEIAKQFLHANTFLKLMPKSERHNYSKLI